MVRHYRKKRFPVEEQHGSGPRSPGTAQHAQPNVSSPFALVRKVSQMPNKKVLLPIDSIDVPPIVKVVQVPVSLKMQLAPGAGPAYQTSTVTNGYGRAGGIVVTIQLGFTVD